MKKTCITLALAIILLSSCGTQKTNEQNKDKETTSIIETKNNKEESTEMIDENQDADTETIEKADDSCYNLTGEARGDCFRKRNHDDNPCIELKGKERGECNRKYFGKD